MPRPEVACPRVSWRMDLMAADLFDGHRFRALAAVDNLGREGLAIEAGQGTTGAGVAAVNESGG